MMNVLKRGYERDYQRLLAKKLKGKEEVVLPCGLRVDILTDTHAWEVDFAKKYFEGIGQALTYATLTKRKPALALIAFTKKDFDKAKICRDVCEKFNIKLLIVDGNKSFQKR